MSRFLWFTVYNRTHGTTKLKNENKNQEQINQNWAFFQGALDIC